MVSNFSSSISIISVVQLNSEWISAFKWLYQWELRQPHVRHLLFSSLFVPSTIFSVSASKSVSPDWTAISFASEPIISTGVAKQDKNKLTIRNVINKGSRHPRAACMPCFFPQVLRIASAKMQAAKRGRQRRIRYTFNLTETPRLAYNCQTCRYSSSRYDIWQILWL